MTVDRHGNLLVSTQTSMYRPGEVSVPGTAEVQVVGGATGTFYGQRMVPCGLYPIAARCPTFYCAPGFSGDGGPATAATFGPATAVEATLAGPDGIEPYGADGGLVILDGGNDRVRAVTG